MKDAIINFLNNSKVVHDLISNLFGTSDYKFDFFEMDREEFLDVFETRLKINEEQNKKNALKNDNSALRSLIENYKYSNDSKILCILIEDINFPIYTNLTLTKIYGYIV